MSSLDDYAEWIVANQDKRGTPDFDTVARAYEQAEAEEGIDLDFSRMGAEFLGGSLGAAAAVVAGQMGPQIVTPEEIMTVPIATGLGAAAAGRIHDAIEDAFTDKEPGTPMHKAAESVVDFMANAVGARAGELLGPLTQKLFAKTGGILRSGTNEVAKAFNQIGVDPMAGAAGNQTVSGVEQALAKLPFSGDVIGKEYTRVIDGMDSFAKREAAKLSATEGNDAVGRVIRTGVDGFVDRFTTKARELYDAIPINPQTRVIPATFNTQIERIGGEFAADETYDFLTPALVKQLRAASEGVTDGTMSFGTLKALRSRIGKRIDAGKLIGDAEQGDLKQLYGALSDDMARISAEHGDAALMAYKRANSFWRAGRDRIDKILKPMVQSEIDADIYSAVWRGSKQGAKRLRTLKSSLDPDAWDSVVAQGIRDMGRASAGQQDETLSRFSANRFMSNYAALQHSGATKVLFGGEKYKGLDEAMTALMKASAAMKESGKLANFPNTASANVYMSILTGTNLVQAGAGNLLEAAALQGLGLVSPYAASKLITSPGFIRWLTKSATTTTTTRGMTQHMAQLGAIAATDDETAAAIQEYLQVLVLQSPAVKGSDQETPD